MTLAWIKTTCALFALTSSATAFGAVMPSHVVLVNQPVNGDYLNHVEAPPHEKTLHETIFDTGISNDLSARYNEIHDSYESRRHYGLNQMEEQFRYKEANKNLADWTMHRMLDDKIRSPLRKWAWQSVRNEFRHRDSPSAAGKSGEVHGAAVEGVTGSGAQSGNKNSSHESSGFSFLEMYRTVENFYNHGLRLDGDNALMKFQYDMPAGVMDLALTGSIVDTSFDYYVLPLAFTSTGGFGGNSANSERAAVSVSKSLGSLGLSTGVHYGLGSRALSYGMNKHLIGPLSAAVNQAHYGADSSKDETTYRLNMGIVF